MTANEDRWALASLAVQCLAEDPAGLGGLVLRSRVGPVRDRFLDLLHRIDLPQSRIPPTIPDDQLFGGVDLAATLATGRVVMSKGLLHRPRGLILTMAERTEIGLAARLSQHIDRESGSCVIALDEGTSADECVTPVLAGRLAFHVDLEGLSVRDCSAPTSPPRAPADGDHVPDNAAAEITDLAARFGITNCRAILLALRTARAHARLGGRSSIVRTDIAAAAALVFPSRATQIPDTDVEDADTPPPQDHQNDNLPSEDGAQGSRISDMMVEAVLARLPSGLLKENAQSSAKGAARGSGAGQKRVSNRRGRPLPPRPGRADGRHRIDLVSTLRAAAPWQPLRRKTHPEAAGILVRKSDIRLRRFEETSDRLLIFTVDASGSSAVSRLNEAKGAVELLLAEAYARRDHVALIAFRGYGSDLLLPPTRSLVQTKRRLAALPGGGGTPLAAGLNQAGDLARQSIGKGLTPTVVLMTDGRANIALDGTADRPKASADTETVAKSLRQSGIPGLMIDTSTRPQQALRSLAAILDAPYVALPRANAEATRKAVNSAMNTG